MPAEIQVEGADRAAFRLIKGFWFHEARLAEATSSVMAQAKAILEKEILTRVYMHEPGLTGQSTYKRTYHLYHSVRTARFMRDGGQVYISRQDLHDRYYPVFVDRGPTRHMLGRHFWFYAKPEMESVLALEMVRASNATLRMMAEGV